MGTVLSGEVLRTELLSSSVGLCTPSLHLETWRVPALPIAFPGLPEISCPAATLPRYPVSSAASVVAPVTSHLEYACLSPTVWARLGQAGRGGRARHEGKGREGWRSGGTLSWIGALWAAWRQEGRWGARPGWSPKSAP